MRYALWSRDEHGDGIEGEYPSESLALDAQRCRERSDAARVVRMGHESYPREFWIVESE